MKAPWRPLALGMKGERRKVPYTFLFFSYFLMLNDLGRVGPHTYPPVNT